MKRRIPLAPAEGWLTLGCVVLICLTMTWAIDDARWVLGRPEYLDYLSVAAVGGALAGFIGPKVGWGRWLTYLIGSIFAALIIPLLTGMVASLGGASLQTLYETTAASVVAAYVDLARLNLSTTTQYLHYVFAFGILVWATSMFASYAVFGHRRPLNGVVAVGVVLVTNMALTTNDELAAMVAYTIGSLFLLIRAHVFDQQSEWLRRRIGDPASISSVYLRGGSGFIAAAVGAAFLLTSTAASAPLAGAWGGVEDGLIGISRSFQRFLPTGGSNRSVTLSFGPNTPVGQLWSTDSSLALTIQRDPTDNGKYYWRAITYDRIEARGWSQSVGATAVIPAGATILDLRADNVSVLGRHSLTFTVTPGSFGSSTIVSPETPITVDENVRLTTVGQDGYFATMDRDGGTGPYTITALTLVDGNDPGQLSVAALRATDTTYPDEIKALYLAVPDGALGPNALKLEAKILAEAESPAPIDLADQLVTELHSSAYTYQTDIRALDCATLSTAECFATYRQGFCQYYAATMALILRDLGVPTRIAEGFLPGSRAQLVGSETILVSNAHAWVEVWFPDFGWVPFDPTGGNLSQIAPLPSGVPVAAGSARPSAIAGASASQRDPRVPIERDPGSTGPGGLAVGTAAAGPLIAVALLLVVVIGGLAFVAWQRGPRGPTNADGAYGTVTRIASRFGFGPRPAQTVYEYAGALGDVLPAVRPELQTVAAAKVESAYGRAILSQERLDSLRAAQRRLRVSLLRLAFRRRQRPRR